MNQLPKPPKLPGGRRHDEVFNPRKLFVGGLSKDTTQQQFREYWEKWGELEDCVVMVDPQSQKSRGFGFVVFTSQSIASDILCRGDSLTMHGRKLDIKKAVPRSNSGNKLNRGSIITPTNGTTGIGQQIGHNPLMPTINNNNNHRPYTQHSHTMYDPYHSPSTYPQSQHRSTSLRMTPSSHPHHHQHPHHLSPYSAYTPHPMHATHHPSLTRPYSAYPIHATPHSHSHHQHHNDNNSQSRGERGGIITGGIGGGASYSQRDSTNHRDSSRRYRRNRARSDKLFVGGLAESFTDDTLHSYFIKYGQVQDAVVMFDKDGNSRRFGFVTFVNPDNANIVLNDGKHIINGVKVTIERAIPKDQINTNSSSSRRGGASDRDRSRDRGDRTHRDRSPPHSHHAHHPYSPPIPSRYDDPYYNPHHPHSHPPPPPHTMYNPHHRGPPPPPPIYSPPPPHPNPTPYTHSAAAYPHPPPHIHSRPAIPPYTVPPTHLPPHPTTATAATATGGARPPYYTKPAPARYQYIYPPPTATPATATKKVTESKSAVITSSTAAIKSESKDKGTATATATTAATVKPTVNNNNNTTVGTVPSVSKPLQNVSTTMTAAAPMSGYAYRYGAYYGRYNKAGTVPTATTGTRAAVVATPGVGRGTVAPPVHTAAQYGAYNAVYANNAAYGGHRGAVTATRTYNPY